MSTGYKGFKPWAGQECPTLKPGESYDSRATKFSKMGYSIMNNQSPSIRVGNPSFESISKSTFGHSKEHNIVPKSSPVEDIASGGRIFLGQTIYQSDFLHFKQVSYLFQMQYACMNIYLMIGLVFA